jgi:C_GCAxxG_C_C family probable redox protein
MSKVEQAVCFKEGFNCSQAICSAYGQDYDLDAKTALKVACGLGAGMGRMGAICGAVTGAYMVIGLKYGQSDILDLAAKEKTYKLVREFSEKFKSRNGSIVCKELLGIDLSTVEGMKAAKERNIHGTCCQRFVKDAAEILEEILSV